jgi:autotransporter-associated beta strand protein
LVFSNTVNGTGSVTKDGNGTLTLTADNTYTGGTAISAGTLSIGNGSTSGSITGAISNNGALVFNRSDASTYSGAINGNGSVTKNGDGTLTLAGANGVGGTGAPIRVSASTLNLSSERGSIIVDARRTDAAVDVTLNSAVALFGTVSIIVKWDRLPPDRNTSYIGTRALINIPQEAA